MSIGARKRQRAGAVLGQGAGSGANDAGDRSIPRAAHRQAEGCPRDGADVGDRKIARIAVDPRRLAQRQQATISVVAADVTQGSS